MTAPSEGPLDYGAEAKQLAKGVTRSRRTISPAAAFQKVAGHIAQFRWS